MRQRSCSLLLSRLPPGRIGALFLLALVGSILLLTSLQWSLPPPPLSQDGIRDIPAPLHFSCSNIAQIQLNTRNVIGKGVTKHAFLGKFRGQQVVVKMVTSRSLDIKQCLRRSSVWRQECQSFANLKLLKEIVLHQELRHRALIQMLGFCVRSEEINSLSLTEHGISAVYEYAMPLQVHPTTHWEWPKRLQEAWALLDLLDFLHHSRLGSLLLADLKPNHLLLRPPPYSSIAISDLDDVTSVETKCDASLPCRTGVVCKMGRCRGQNARLNLALMNDVILSDLLQCTRNCSSSALTSFCFDLQEGQVPAARLRDRLKDLFPRIERVQCS